MLKIGIKIILNIKKNIVKKILEKVNKKQYIYKVCFGKCVKCKKTIERVGVFTRQDKELIGFIGNNCPFCGCKKKADIKNIDFISDLQKKL